MAFGVNPKHQEILNLNGTSHEHYIAVAIEAVRQLEWEIATLSVNGFVAYTGGHGMIAGSQVQLILQDEEAQITSRSLGSEMMDWGRNKKYINRFIETYNEITASISDEKLQELTDKSQLMIARAEQEALEHSADKADGSFFSLFVPRPGYFITPILININILVFVLMVLTGVSLIAPGTDSLIAWGADLRPLVLEGQWWRLFTNMFIHIGIIHLLLNMYALMYIGILLEPHLGKFKFAALYILTGIAASVASTYWHQLTVSAGASGAIFGLYGVFVALLIGNFIDKATRKALLTSIMVFIGYNLVNGLKAGVDNAAHIGGLVTGFLAGLAYIPALKKPSGNDSSYITTGIVTAIIVMATAGILHVLPNDFGTYDANMNEFQRKENLALKVYRMPNATNTQVLDEIKNNGLRYWKENLALIKQTDKLELPDAAHERNKKLIEYCNLRIQSYGLLYKAVAERTDVYKPQLEQYNSEIGALVDSLKAE